MTREIKFRAWDEQNGYFIDEHDFHVDPDGKVCVYDEPSEVWMYSGPIILQQFTGLKDKNGKEIYEGDVVRVQSQYETDEPVDSINEVYFQDGDFRCGFHNMILGGKVCTGCEGNWNMEVIGNIYENTKPQINFYLKGGRYAKNKI